MWRFFFFFFFFGLMTSLIRGSPLGAPLPLTEHVDMVKVAVAEIGCNAILLTMYLVDLILYNIIGPPPTGDPVGNDSV